MHHISKDITRGQRNPQEEVKNICLSILSGISHLNHHNLQHYDIKGN